MKELTIKIYESNQCGFKYDIFNDDSPDDSIDGGHCTSDLVNALEMATDQAMAIALKERDDEHAKNLAIYNALSAEDKEEVDQRINDQKQGDADNQESGGDYWEGTEQQYLAWALEEFEENNGERVCEICGKPEDDDGRCGCTNQNQK